LKGFITVFEGSLRSPEAEDDEELDDDDDDDDAPLVEEELECEFEDTLANTIPG
jgi:hypothetical protein